MTEKEKLDYLEKNGIDTHTGLKYADDSFAFYMQLIGVFLDEYEAKSKIAQREALREGTDYAVLVHGLKNNARALGATALADLSYEHEKAAKAGDGTYIKENLPELLSLWQETVSVFGNVCNQEVEFYN